MITKFKIFEINNEYKVGDYIRLNFTTYIFKIIKINKKWPNPYLIEYLEINKFCQMNITYNDIERFATPLEIERYELKISIFKYNI
jgi:hypothetical protein